jgi:YD repeat-containing protein
MARLTSSAQSVSVTVGATVDTPGGAAAYVYGYDAAGKLVSQNSALVGAANQGQNPGLAQTVRLTAGRGQSIRYVALYFAEYSTTGGPQLMFNNLAYTGP